MALKDMFVLFMSLALGYVMCILARKEKSMLKTVGYTLGICIIAMTLLYGFFASQMYCSNLMTGKAARVNCPSVRHPMSAKGVR